MRKGFASDAAARNSGRVEIQFDAAGLHRAAPLHTLRRAVECYDHGDGFAAIRERFAAAQTSWASVREAHSLCRALMKMKGTASGSRTRVREDFDRPLQSWIGTRLADEFDLEGTAGQVPEFADLLVRDTLSRRM